MQISELQEYFFNNFALNLSDADIEEVLELSSEILEKRVNCTIDNDSTEILKYLNHLGDKNFSPTKANLKFIIARLKEKNKPELLMKVIQLKCFEWKSDFNMKKYLRPETLFNVSKFESYKNEVLDVQKNPQEFKQYVEQRNTEKQQAISKATNPLDSMAD